MLKLKNKNAIRMKKQRGNSFIENLIALLIFSIGILGIASTQGNLLKSNTEAKMRNQAMVVANQIVGKMWMNSGNLSSFVVTNAALSNDEGSLPNGKKTIAVNGNRVTITINWKRTEETDFHKLVVISYVNPND